MSEERYYICDGIGCARRIRCDLAIGWIEVSPLGFNPQLITEHALGGQFCSLEHAAHYLLMFARALHERETQEPARR